MWSAYTDLVRAALFAFAHLLGGSVGGAILVMTLLVRLALMPLTLRLARRAHERALAMAKLAPRIELLQKRHAADPAKAYREISALHRRAGVPILDSHGMLGGLAQAPAFLGLYGAISRGFPAGTAFLWIRDLARPSALVAIAGAAVAALVPFTAPATGAASAQKMALVSAVLAASVTLLVLLRASSGLGLYWVASSGMSVLQNAVLRRQLRRAADMAQA